MPPEQRHVEFEEDNFLSNKSSRGQSQGQNGTESNVKGLSGWIISHHLAKNEKSAQYVLVGVLLFNVILTIIIIRSFL